MPRLLERCAGDGALGRVVPGDVARVHGDGGGRALVARRGRRLDRLLLRRRAHSLLAVHAVEAVLGILDPALAERELGLERLHLLLERVVRHLVLGVGGALHLREQVQELRLDLLHRSLGARDVRGEDGVARRRRRRHRVRARRLRRRLVVRGERILRLISARRSLDLAEAISFP